MSNWLQDSSSVAALPVRKHVCLAGVLVSIRDMAAWLHA